MDSVNVRRAQAEDGVTLVELIITVAIMSILFLVLLGGMGTAVIGSDYHRKQAISQAALASYVDAIRADTYVSCPLVASYSGTGYTNPSGFTASTTSIEFWDSTTDTWEPTCPLTEGGLQRISVRVVSSDARANESTQFVKRKP